MQRAVVRWSTLALAALISVAPAHSQVAQGPDLVPLEDPGLTLSKEELPGTTVVGAWALFIGGFQASGDQDAAIGRILGRLGLDPTSETVLQLADLHNRYWKEFKPANLAEQYRSSPLAAEKVQRNWGLRRSRWLGREVGKWFRELEREGVDTGLLVERILESPTFSMTRTVYNEEEIDTEALELQTREFNQAFEKQLGRPLTEKGGRR